MNAFIIFFSSFIYFNYFLGVLINVLIPFYLPVLNYFLLHINLNGYPHFFSLLKFNLAFFSYWTIFHHLLCQSMSFFSLRSLNSPFLIMVILFIFITFVERIIRGRNCATKHSYRDIVVGTEKVS